MGAKYSIILLYMKPDFFEVFSYVLLFGIRGVVELSLGTFNSNLKFSSSINYSILC